MKNYMLSFDVSTKSTGVSVFLNGKYKESFVIDRNMHLSLWQICEKYKPIIIVVEKPIVLRNATTQSKLDRLVGLLEWWSIKQTDKTGFWVDFIEYRPNEWRRFIKNEDEKLPKKREQLKEWALDKCNALKIQTDNDDVAESVLIGYAHLIELGLYGKTEKYI